MILIQPHLAFYLKYPQQMQYLTQENPDLRLLEDADAVREQAARIDELAEIEGKEFTEQIGDRLTKLLTGMANIEVVRTKRNWMKWGRDLRISPLNGGQKILIGFSLYRDGSGICPWFNFRNYLVAEHAWNLIVNEMGGYRPEKDDGGWTIFMPVTDFSKRLSEQAPIDVEQEVDLMLAPFQKLNPTIVEQLCNFTV